MVTKFKSEYGNSDLQRNRGKYENRPDLKKRKRERKWRGENGRLENLISELHRLRLARSSSVRKLRAGIVIRSGRRCAQFILLRRGVNRRGEKSRNFVKHIKRARLKKTRRGNSWYEFATFYGRLICFFRASN